MCVTPYQQQAELDFDEPFRELFAEKIRKKNSSTPPQVQADLDFYESFCTFWLIEIQVRLFLIGGGTPEHTLY